MKIMWINMHCNDDHDFNLQSCIVVEMGFELVHFSGWSLYLHNRKYMSS